MSNTTPAPSNATPSMKKVVTPRKAACRIFAIVFFLLAVAAIVAIPYSILSTEASTPLYQAILSIFPANWYQVTEGALNLVYNIGIYAFAVFSAVSAILFLIVIIFAKRVPLIIGSILLTVGAFVFTVLHMIVSAVAGAFEVELFSLILTGVALILTIIGGLVTRPRVEEVEESEVTENAPDDGFHVEEYAEAYPYEGGPVAGVLMAEEVNPTFIPQSPRVNTAGYDFYNSKTFDTFISSLNDQERNDFTEIFILKIKGPMPELPDYQVGGDNKEFFRKIFIYLGQYRDRIPSALLGKIYQYSLKIN